jgi:V/A-type H+-transporting ATPase subunit C
MLRGGAFAYANINARVRANYARLIPPDIWAELINAPSLGVLISLLRRTDYGPYLMQLGENESNPQQVVFQIERQMADTFQRIIQAAPDVSCPLLIQFYRSYEVDNLKAILRGIRSGATWPQIEHTLFPLGEFSVLPAEAMVESGSISTAIELLHGTPYYVTLSHAAKRFNVEQSLFPFEVALDINYWREIWRDINALPKDDRQHAIRILGSLLDATNLLWAIRYRVYFKLSEEEIINYTLPFGYRVKDADILAIAGGADISQIVARIYPDITDLPSLLEEPRKGLPLVEVELERQVMKESRAAFLGNPFNIGVPLAYLVLKKMEIRDLIVLVEAKAAQAPTEEFQPYLLVGTPSSGTP